MRSLRPPFVSNDFNVPPRDDFAEIDSAMRTLMGEEASTQPRETYRHS